jgi:hypothetical protein
MIEKLEQYLLAAQGKNKGELPADNPYRDVGFDKEKKRLGWLRVLPFSAIKESLDKVGHILEGKETFIFVGMGGSINGIKTLFSLCKNHSLYTLDNLDPLAIKDLLGKIKDIKKTLVISISKSGTTQETQLLSHTLKELFANSWQGHFLWIADSPAFGKLDSLGWEGVNKLAIQFDADTDIGGRFSSPQTVIFFLPLFLLLKKDFNKLENIYKNYIDLQKDVRKQAKELADKYCRSEYAYFFPTVKEGFSERLSSWIVQLFQESLGSKKDGLSVKTTCSSENKSDLFLPLELKIRISDPVVSLMAQMYFFQVFIAFYSALKKINFVDQDYVEKYKDQMRRLEGKSCDPTHILNLKQIVKAVKENIASHHKFIEVVLYFYPDKKLIAKINKVFCENFKERLIFVFVGSDWNHHSYQAAFGDKNTFYVLLQADSYETRILPFSEKTLKSNINTLKTISRATYLTLKDKSVLFSIPR